MQEGQHQAVPQLQDQVPSRVPQGEATHQEAQDHFQGVQAQLVHVIGLSRMLPMLCVLARKSGKILPVEVLVPCVLSTPMFPVMNLNDAMQTPDFGQISYQQTAYLL